MKRIVLASLALALAAAAVSPRAAAPVRILIVDGESGGPYHAGR